MHYVQEGTILPIQQNFGPTLPLWPWPTLEWWHSRPPGTCMHIFICHIHRFSFFVCSISRIMLRDSTFTCCLATVWMATQTRALVSSWASSRRICRTFPSHNWAAYIPCTDVYITKCFERQDIHVHVFSQWIMCKVRLYSAGNICQEKFWWIDMVFHYCVKC